MRSPLTVSFAIALLMHLGGCALPPTVGRQGADLSPAAATSPALHSEPLPWLAAPHAAGLADFAPPLLLTSVAVTQLPLGRLLQALSQQEGLSHDIDECAAIPVSLHQHSSELTELLDRITELTRTRWHLRHNRLSIRCDQPFTRTYQIDYPAIERSGLFTGASGLPGGSVLPGGGIGAGGSNGAGPTGSQQTSSRHQSRFWESVSQTVEQWLSASEELSEPTRVTETELTRNDQGQIPTGPDRRGRHPQPASPSVASVASTLESTVSRTVTTRVDQRRNQVTAHPESGLLHVRATLRQHRQLAGMLASVRLRSRQQVEIEASLLEIRLSQQHERGIRWNLHNLALNQGLQSATGSPGLIFSRSASGEDSTGLAIRFLEQFGLVHVVSSPRVVAMHQQAALLRMVENRIFFTVSSQTVPAGPNSAAFSTFSTQAHSTPVGFVMSILPSIDDSGGITLALRPSLSRIIGFVNDPNPGLATAGVSSRIPEVQIREIESVLKLQDGQVALLGGFTQSESRNATAGIPGASGIPALRWLGSAENSEDSHVELVVLIRARITPNGGAA